MDNDGIDIDVSRLTVDDANALRGLFEACAGASRQAGNGAQEAFLIGLAGLCDTFLKSHSEATGEPLPEPLKLSGEGAVNLAALSLQDLARGANLLLRMGQALDADGHEALGSTFADLASVFCEAAQAKVPATERPN